MFAIGSSQQTGGCEVRARGLLRAADEPRRLLPGRSVLRKLCLRLTSVVALAGRSRAAFAMCAALIINVSSCFFIV